MGDELAVDAEEFFPVEVGFKLSQVLVYDKLVAGDIFYKHNAVLGEEESDLIEG